MSTEFVSAYISEDEEDRFKRLVLKDVRGRATDEEIQELSQERQLWLDELILVVQDIQDQITERNVVMTKKMAWDEFNRVKGEVQTWKVSALRFKTMVLNRRRDVKAALKAENMANPQNDSHGQILTKILDELRGIRASLEA